MKKSIFAVIALALVLVFTLVPCFAFAEENSDSKVDVVPTVVDNMDYFVPLATKLSVGPSSGNTLSGRNHRLYNLDETSSLVRCIGSHFWVYDLPQVADMPDFPESTFLLYKLRYTFVFDKDWVPGEFGCAIYVPFDLEMDGLVCTMSVAYYAPDTTTESGYSSTVTSVSVDVLSSVNRTSSYVLFDSGCNDILLSQVRLVFSYQFGSSFSSYEEMRRLSNLQVMFFTDSDTSASRLTETALGLISEYPVYLGTEYKSGYNTGYDSGKNVGYSEGYEAGYAEGDSDGFDDGQSMGYAQGYDDGYSEGDIAGYNRGYNLGHADGVATANDYSFFSLMSSVVDVPINAILSLFNFELFGFNLQPLLTTLLTLCVALAVIKLIL